MRRKPNPKSNALEIIQSRILLLFLSVSPALMALAPVFFPAQAAYVSGFSIFNAIFSVIFGLYAAGSFYSNFLNKHLNSFAFYGSVIFCHYLTVLVYFTSLDFYIMRFYWVFMALSSICFSQKWKVLAILISGYAGTSVVHFLLPPEKIYYAIWSYIIMTPPLAFVFYYLVSQSIDRNKKLVENEHSLYLKTEELNTILDTLNAMVAYKDGNNVLKKVNHALAEFIGKPKQSIEVTSLYDLFEVETAREFHEEDLRVIRTGKPMMNKLEKITCPRTGQARWLRTSKFPFIGENGKIDGIVLSSDDVTDHILAEQKLRESEERFRMIFENAPDGMALIGHPAWHYIKINRAFTEMLGYTEAEILELSPFDIVHTDDHSICHQLYEDIVSSGIKHHASEKRYLHKNGKVVHCSLSVIVVQESGNPKYLIVSLKDITQQKENDLRLKHYARQLEESNQNLQEFAYATSHDLREPLRTVVSYVQLLKRQLPPEHLTGNTLEFMQFVIGGALRMDAQIQALLNYSRVGRGELNITGFDLKDAVGKVCQDLRKQMIDNHAVVEIMNSPEITGDRYQIEALLQNLISNAIKYRSPQREPVILIETSETALGWQISITDNGIGIDEEYLEKIFAVFRRLHNASDIPGTGVGLAICRRIVQRHLGEIWATSKPGAGTTFHITLPKILETGKLHDPVVQENSTLTV